MAWYVMRIITDTEEFFTGDSKGLYLREFYLEAYDGIGMARHTTNINDAMRFPSTEALFEYWRQQSRTRPLRADGKPNRPLTHYTITPVKVDE